MLTQLYVPEPNRDQETEVIQVISGDLNKDQTKTLWWSNLELSPQMAVLF